jgi:hypothetical protein
MKIEWNTETWYSKLIEGVLFVFVLLLGAYFGGQYEQLLGNKGALRGSPVTVVGTNSLASYQYKVSDSPDTSTRKTYENETLGFKLKYPANFELITDSSQISLLLGPDSGTQVLIRKPTTDGSLGDSIAIKKVHTSLRQEIANRFSYNLSSLRWGMTPEFSWILEYRDSALDEARTYLFAKEGATMPGDPGTKVTDILVAQIEAGLGAGINNEQAHSIWDDIVGTVTLTHN